MGSNPIAVATPKVIKLHNILYRTDNPEVTVSSDSWTQVFFIQGTVEPYQNFINYSCEITSDVVDEFIGIKILLDGSEAGFDIKKTHIANQYMKFIDFGMIQPAVEKVLDFEVQVRALNTGVTIKVRKQRVLIQQE